VDRSEAIAKSYSKPLKLPAHSAIAQVVAEVRPDETVLDVGCAEGYLADYLPENRVWGIDGNRDAVQSAATRCIEVATVDLDAIPLTEPFARKFDVLVYADVLEHLLQPERVLVNLATQLSVDGRIVVSLPNVALWRVRLNLLGGRFNYSDYGVMDRTHLHFYTFKSAKQLLENAGFRVVRVTGAANLLGPLVARLPMLRNLLSTQIVLVATAAGSTGAEREVTCE